MKLVHTGKMDKDRLIFRLLASVPLSFWQALSKLSPVIPYYHIVADEDVPHVKHLYGFRNTKQFQEDLDFFLANYSPVGLADVIGHLHQGKVLPKRSFLLTFDDGFREMHDVVAPILKAKGVPATFFLTTGFIDNLDMAHQNKASVLIEHLVQNPGNSLLKEVENLLDKNSIPGADLFSRLLAIRYRDKNLIMEIAAICGCDLAGYLSSARPYLASDQIRNLLRQGFTIGAHSVDHPLYAELSLKDQLFQTRESLRFLLDRFQISYRAFAFPHTDSGVSRDFFEKLQALRTLDASFGTDGMVKHSFPFNLERFTLDKSLLPAKRILAKHYPRGLYRNLFRRTLATAG
jgi:peptidoglycan/xylan/chitin deacetylase (PgdA/CDA1 family)